MRFRQKSLEEIRDQLVLLGLKTCLVCGSEGLDFDLRPAMVDIGGFHHDSSDPRHDPEANVLFAVRVQCEACGHMLFFNSEKFRKPDEELLVKGISREEEARIDPPD